MGGKGSSQVTFRILLLVLLAVAVAGAIGLYESRRRAQYQDSLANQPVQAPPRFKPEEVFPLAADAELLASAVTTSDTTSVPLVMIVPFRGVDDTRVTGTLGLREYLSYQLQAGPLGSPLVSQPPGDYMEGPYMREDNKPPAVRPDCETYRRDAALLGADLLVCGTVEETTPGLAVKLAFTDMHTSTTHEWSDARPVAEVRDLVRAMARETAKACGVPDDKIASSGILAGAPAPTTWDQYRTTTTLSANQSRALLASDPDCTLIYDMASRANQDVTFANEGLKRWPNDRRLIRAKMDVLRDSKRTYASLVLLGELLRREPDNLLVLHRTMAELGEHYTPGSCGPAGTLPPPYKAVVDTVVASAKRAPQDWALQWDAASVCKGLAWLMRGQDTADKVPEANFKVFREYSEKAVQFIDAAAARRPDCPLLLQEQLEMHNWVGDTDIADQKRILARIHELDPSNVRAEMAVAYIHSVGWDNPANFLPLVEESAQRHAGDPRASHIIAWRLAENMLRQVGLGVRTMDQSLKSPTREGALFVQLAEEAWKGGYPPEGFMVHVLCEQYLLSGKQAKLQKLADATSSSYVLERLPKTP